MPLNSTTQEGPGSPPQPSSKKTKPSPQPLNIPLIPIDNSKAVEFFSNYQKSIKDPSQFFSSLATSMLTWSVPFKETFSNFSSLHSVNWFNSGKLNACYNCVDRHIGSNKTAIITYNNDQTIQYTTYESLLTSINRLSNYFKRIGLKKGDVVCLYMPMYTELLIACLACARLGLIHNVVFSGYSAENLRQKIECSNAKLLITAESGFRGNKEILFFNNIKHIINSQTLTHVLIITTGQLINSSSKLGIEIDTLKQKGVSLDIYSEVIYDDSHVECVFVDSNDTLFYLYTSGSTGVSKGIVHSTAGYLLWAALTLQEVFKVDKDSVFFCTADLGWITGHSYVLYGPLMLGCTTVCYGSVPFHPDYNSLFDIIHQVSATHFYTAPTVIRILEKEIGWSNESFDMIREKFTLNSLRALGSVGEPINSKAYNWYSKFFGNNKLPILDTYWQTEAGGFMITPIIGVTEFKAECAGIPFYGMHAEVLKKVNDENNKIKVEKCKSGELGVIGFKKPWPGMCKGILDNRERFLKEYFGKFEGYYTTGDEGYRDENGYFWIRGRVDDIINVSGHKISTAELENVVSDLDIVSGCAAIGIEDEISGNAIVLFTVLNNNTQREKEESEIKEMIENSLKVTIGRIIRVKKIFLVKDLPKTRTGKIMRRVLKKIVEKEEIGDVSTCSNLEVIEDIIEEVRK